MTNQQEGGHTTKQYYTGNIIRTSRKNVPSLGQTCKQAVRSKTSVLKHRASATTEWQQQKQGDNDPDTDLNAGHSIAFRCLSLAA